MRLSDMQRAPPISYKDFRTGLTYRDVYHIIYMRRYKRRHGVLGAWREIKLAMYGEYINEYNARAAEKGKRNG